MNRTHAGLYSLIAASFATCVMNWNEDVAIFMTRCLFYLISMTHWHLQCIHGVPFLHFKWHTNGVSISGSGNSNAHIFKKTRCCLLIFKCPIFMTGCFSYIQNYIEVSQVAQELTTIGMWGETDKDPEDAVTRLLLCLGLWICSLQKLPGHWRWLQRDRPPKWHHHWPSPGLHCPQGCQGWEMGKAVEIGLWLCLLLPHGACLRSQSYRVTEGNGTDIKSQLFNNHYWL